MMPKQTKKQNKKITVIEILIGISLAIFVALTFAGFYFDKKYTDITSQVSPCTSTSTEYASYREKDY